MAQEMNNEDIKRFGIYDFALKYLDAFEIEFQESVNAISWKYADDRKEATIYKKPLKDEDGCIYYGRYSTSMRFANANSSTLSVPMLS